MKKLLPHFTLALHATINVSLIKTGDHDSAGTEDVAERLEVEVADHRPSDESSIASMSPTAMETAIEGANLMIPRLEREIEVVDRQLSEEKAITMILQNDNKTSMATIARQAEELEMYRLEISRKKKELESQAREIVGLRNFSSTSSEKVILAVKSLQTTHQDQLRKLCSHATKDIDNLKEEKEETETEIKKTRKAELQSKDEQAQEVSKLRQKIINNEETHAIEIWTLQQELADTRVIGKMAASANTEPAPQGVSKLGTETKVAAEVDTAEMIGITVGKEKERTAEKKVSLSASGEEAPFTRPEVPIDSKHSLLSSCLSESLY